MIMQTIENRSMVNKNPIGIQIRSICSDQQAVTNPLPDLSAPGPAVPAPEDVIPILLEKVGREGEKGA